MTFDRLSDSRKVGAIRDEFIILLMGIVYNPELLKTYIPETDTQYKIVSDILASLIRKDCTCNQCIDTFKINTNVIPAELEPLLDAARTLAAAKSY